MATTAPTTVGRYLGGRLRDIGLGHFFTVPGDYNLVLLDELLETPELEMIGCCNELNAGYAADGYARATGGAAAVVVTYSVGGLSALNAVAGAYAEDLPVIVISGGPNTNSAAEYELLHHTLGKVDYQYQRDIFARVTADTAVIHHPREAPRQIDRVLETALRKRKPVYIEVACNIARGAVSVPSAISPVALPASDPASLADAVDHASGLLDAAVKPVLVAGVKLKPFGAVPAFAKLADACGYAVATMPNAKGLFAEDHPAYMGTYWGSVSSPGCAEIVESSDLYLFAGPTFTDYTTVGHSALIEPAKLICAGPDCAVLPDAVYTNVALGEFLEGLAAKTKRNETSLNAFSRLGGRAPPERASRDGASLTTRLLFDRIQAMLDERTTVIAETGDSWFNAIDLRLPHGAGFEIQMQYGSIGWSVGATLGYSLGASDGRSVVALIGDGSFQLTAQEISTMIRYGLRPIIFLINNGGYTIEVEIHDGPYNSIKNWDYAGLVDVFSAGEGQCTGHRVITVDDLDRAIASARERKGLSLIEVRIDRDDCSKDLLEWGSHVARNNGRPPRFQHD
ncbi:MAG: thiamine pyrophosphate-binding protein [Gammaproteobacteria bacterium]|nr:thiamine pyrophosphate-binding protein [Gammaproteobacteria bacterium]